jgi:hypothetical protein
MRLPQQNFVVKREGLPSPVNLPGNSRYMGIQERKCCQKSSQKAIAMSLSAIGDWDD